MREAKLSVKKKRFKTQNEFIKKLVSSSFFKIFALIVGVFVAIAMLLIFSSGFRNAIIDTVASLLNVFVISNLFVCNLIVVGVIVIAILITIFIYTRT